MRRSVMLLAAVLLAGSGCSAGEDDGEPRATLGEVVEAPIGFEIEGRPSYVLTPDLRYDFVISSPRDRLGYSAASEAGLSEEARDGTAFIGVAWSIAQLPGDGTIIQSIRPDVPVTTTLVVDDREYDLGDIGVIERSGAYAVVPDDADEVRLEVEYDGLVQVIEDVYDPTVNRPREPELPYLNAAELDQPACPDTALTGARAGDYFVAVGCYLQSTGPVAYQGDLGWAEPGRAWVVVDLTVDRGFGGYDGGDGGNYELTGRDVRLRLEGAAGAPEIVADDSDRTPGTQDDGSWQARAVFDVPADWDGGQLVAVRAYDAVPQSSGPGAPDPVVATFRRSFEIDD